MNVTDPLHLNPDPQSNKAIRMSRLEVHLPEGRQGQLSKEYLHYQDQFGFSTCIKPSNERSTTKSKFESQQLLSKMRKKLP